MEKALYGMLGAVIKEFHRRLTEEPGEIKASMFAQMISLFNQNGITVQNMSKARAAEIMKVLDSELDWDSWEDQFVCPPAEEPLPTRVTQ